MLVKIWLAPLRK